MIYIILCFIDFENGFMYKRYNLYTLFTRSLTGPYCKTAFIFIVFYCCICAEYVILYKYISNKMVDRVFLTQSDYYFKS